MIVGAPQPGSQIRSTVARHAAAGDGGGGGGGGGQGQQMCERAYGKRRHHANT